MAARSRIALGLATACLLAGCYQSKTLLLDLAQAAHPFADGTWVGDDEDRTTVRLEKRGQAYLMVEGEDRRDLVMTPLPGHERTWAAAQADEGCLDGSNTGDCDWEYAVLAWEDDRLREIAPNCEKDFPAIAGHVASRNEGGDTCWFDDRDKLLQALGYVAGKPGAAAITYTHGKDPT